MGAPLGEVIYASVKPIIRMYLIIGTGLAMTRGGLLSIATTRALSDMAVLVFMPALVLDKLINYIDIDDIKTIGVLCLSALLMYALNAAAAGFIVYVTPVPKSKTSRWVGGAILAEILQNVSDLPIAYLQAMSFLSTTLQDKGTAYVIIWLAMYVLFQFNCGMFQLVQVDFDYMKEHSNDPDALEELRQKEMASSDSSLDIEAGAGVEGGGAAPDAANGTPIEATDTVIAATDTVVAPDTDTAVPNTTISSTASSASSLSSGPAAPQSDPVQLHASGVTAENGSVLTAPTSAVSRTTSYISSINSLTTSTSSIVPQALTRRVTSRLGPRPAIARIPSARIREDYEDPVSLYSEDMRVTSHASHAPSLTEELVKEYSHVEPHNRTSRMAKIITETGMTRQDVRDTGKDSVLVKKHKYLGYVIFFMENFKKPNSLALIIGLIISLVPWLKALFVTTGTVTLPSAPDNEPALSFFLTYFNYLGQPCVPLGLLLIGSVLGRIEISNVPPGFWKCVLCHVVWRLCIMPVIGVLWVKKLQAMDWLDDPMSMLVTCIEFGLPSATVQIYLTASSMEPGDKRTTPITCLGCYMFAQYAACVVTLPIIVCYVIKNIAGM